VDKKRGKGERPGRLTKRIVVDPTKKGKVNRGLKGETQLVKLH